MYCKVAQHRLVRGRATPKTARAGWWNARAVEGGWMNAAAPMSNPAEMFMPWVLCPACFAPAACNCSSRVSPCDLLPTQGAHSTICAAPVATQVPSIWAIGDVTDRMNLTPGVDPYGMQCIRGDWGQCQQACWASALPHCCRRYRRRCCCCCQGCKVRTASTRSKSFCSGAHGGQGAGGHALWWQEDCA